MGLPLNKHLPAVSLAAATTAAAAAAAAVAAAAATDGVITLAIPAHAHQRGALMTLQSIVIHIQLWVVEIQRRYHTAVTQGPHTDSLSSSLQLCFQGQCIQGQLRHEWTSSPRSSCTYGRLW